MEMEFEALFHAHLLLPPVRIRRRSPQPPRWFPNRFTSTELDAAELLVQLSGSSSGQGDGVFSAAGEEMNRTPKPSSADSSPRSVNTRPPPPEDVLLEVEDDVGDDEAMGPRRKVKRYRAIADVYAATRPIGGGAKKAQKRRREGERGSDGEH